MQKQLRDGLILRSLSEGVASDRERLPDFYAAINTEHDPEEGKEAVRHWVRDLMDGHPTTTHDDIFVVVDPARDDLLVSATLLIPQTWRYEDIVLSVGRPELVATHPDYRNRGLVRELFEVVHERSAALGHQLQVITGIPHYYRKFGYAMAVDLGYHATYPLHVAEAPKPDYQPAYTLRPATLDDVPKLAEWYDYFAAQRLLTEARSQEVWRYEIAGYGSGSAQHMQYMVIVNKAGEGVGYVELMDFRWEKYIIRCPGYVVGDQASYLETFDDVIQGVKQWALATYGECPALLVFGSGIHEALDSLIDRTTGGHVQSLNYAWYLRVPDTIAFLRHIQPVLERRLEGSGAHRFTGELKIGYYDLTGICLRFERGHLSDISSITGKDDYDISFPYHLFLNVLFGQYSNSDISAVLPEVWGNAKATVLFNALFPKKQSWVKGLL